jgi:hypothetical protein
LTAEHVAVGDRTQVRAKRTRDVGGGQGPVGGQLADPSPKETAVPKNPLRHPPYPPLPKSVMTIARAFRRGSVVTSEQLVQAYRDRAAAQIEASIWKETEKTPLDPDAVAYLSALLERRVARS